MKHCLLSVVLLLPLHAQDASKINLTQLRELYKSGKWSELSDAFEEMTPSERGRYLITWVEALERCQRWPRLIEVCESAEPQLAGKPESNVLASKRIKALVKLDRLGEAVKGCERLGDGGDPYFYVMGLEHARQASDWAAMDVLATKLLANRPTDPIGLAVKGEALARLERFADAEPFLKQATAANPKDPWIWVNLAGCLNERKAWSEALEACDHALAMDPSLAHARINRGRACFELARYAEAKADYEAALALLPGNPVLLENLRQTQRYLEAQQKGRKGKG